MKETPHKNICFFNTTPFWGGGEKWHLEAALMSNEKGLNTFFVANKNSVIGEKLATTSIHPFFIKTTRFSFLNPLKISKLITFFKANEIETVIFNSPNDLKLGGIAAYFAKIPTVVYRRGIAVKIKNSFLNKWLFTKVITHFIFNSEATKKLVLENFNTILNTKKTAIIYNAIEFPKNTNNIEHVPNTVFTIGNAGRLVEQKGQYFLLDIAQFLKNKNVAFKILIAGEGPLFGELQEKIQKNGLAEQIKLLGFVSDIHSFMQQIDVFVSTAKWEGFGFVLAEAMTFKKPTLAFDVSSNPELISNEKTGFLIPAFNTEVFAEKLIALNNNREKLKQMGNEGYLFAQENFAKEKQFEKLMEFIP
ncbi:MAG: glycosyltransferase family 1 protein [Bacteroidetes bacterium HGW-Bacteroidetes-12]|nr:MAG: glycosyltransferase family 1 protein [Bacteroidetes bacterium HGW-Bacteroidetes-12]